MFNLCLFNLKNSLWKQAVQTITNDVALYVTYFIQNPNIYQIQL